jgi:hypothetical protein
MISGRAHSSPPSAADAALSPPWLLSRHRAPPRLLFSPTCSAADPPPRPPYRRLHLRPDERRRLHLHEDLLPTPLSIATYCSKLLHARSLSRACSYCCNLWRQLLQSAVAAAAAAPIGVAGDCSNRRRGCYNRRRCLLQRSSASATLGGSGCYTTQAAFCYKRRRILVQAAPAIVANAGGGCYRAPPCYKEAVETNGGATTRRR